MPLTRFFRKFNSIFCLLSMLSFSANETNYTVACSHQVIFHHSNSNFHQCSVVQVRKEVFAKKWEEFKQPREVMMGLEGEFRNFSKKKKCFVLHVDSISNGLSNDVKLDDPKLRDCAHFILFLVTLGCRPHSSAFLWHWRLVRSLKKVG